MPAVHFKRRKLWDDIKSHNATTARMSGMLGHNIQDVSATDNSREDRHISMATESDLEDKMYLVRPDAESQWSRSSSPKVTGAETTVLETLPLSDDAPASMVVSRSLPVRDHVTDLVASSASPHHNNSVPTLGGTQLVGNHVMTIDQLTPERLIELQSKGLLHIASVAGPAASSFIVSTRGSNMVAGHGHPLPIAAMEVFAKQAEDQIDIGRDMCVVCGDRASGRHYGAKSCEGCKGFFKRSIRKKLSYTCRGNQTCSVNKRHRNRCQYCRLQKCLAMGMKSDSVQCERSPMQKSTDENHRLVGAISDRSLYQSRSIPTALDGSAMDTADKLNEGNLSTLASVVSTMAHMSKTGECDSGKLERPAMTDERNGTFEKLEDAPKILESLNETLKACTPRCGSLEASPGQTQTPVLDFEGPLMTESNFSFELNMPNPPAGTFNVHYICESASRLLFLSAQWARSIFAFQLLRTECHTSLLRDCWHELFILGLAQCAKSMKLGKVLATILKHLRSNFQQGKQSASRVEQVVTHISKLQDFVGRMQKLEVDAHEYAYLKSMTLFSPDHVSHEHRTQVLRFQTRTIAELRDHHSKHFPEEPDRICHLLLTLPTLRSLSSTVTEELFFAGLIGNVQIDSIIPYILRMETSDFTGGLVGDSFQPKTDLASDAARSPQSPQHSGVQGEIAHEYHSSDSEMLIGSYSVEQSGHERLLDNSSIET